MKNPNTSVVTNTQHFRKPTLQGSTACNQSEKFSAQPSIDSLWVHQQSPLPLETDGPSSAWGWWPFPLPTGVTEIGEKGADPVGGDPITPGPQAMCPIPLS